MKLNNIYTNTKPIDEEEIMRYRIPTSPINKLAIDYYYVSTPYHDFLDNYEFFLSQIEQYGIIKSEQMPIEEDFYWNYPPNTPQKPYRVVRPKDDFD
jgi:hypothetical protein